MEGRFLPLTSGSPGCDCDVMRCASSSLLPGLLLFRNHFPKNAQHNKRYLPSRNPKIPFPNLKREEDIGSEFWSPLSPEQIMGLGDSYFLRFVPYLSVLNPRTSQDAKMSSLVLFSFMLGCGVAQDQGAVCSLHGTAVPAGFQGALQDTGGCWEKGKGPNPWMRRATLYF